MTTEQPAKVDVSERGNNAEGQPITLDRRLFVQLLGFSCEPGLPPGEAVQQLAKKFEQTPVGSVIYRDVNHPRGLALLSFTEDPSHFVTEVQPALESLGAGLTARPELSMLGRTYSTGYEQDLEYWLLRRPRETALNANWPWA